MDEVKQLHKKGMQLQLSSVWLPRKQRKWKKKNHKSFPVLIHMKPTYNMKQNHYTININSIQFSPEPNN